MTLRHSTISQEPQEENEDSMGMINGIGTTLYGKRDLTKEELDRTGIKINKKYENFIKPHISTKWFAFFFIPLIPLGSYIVFLEQDNPTKGWFTYSNKSYSMIRINLNWNQVLKTWLITLAVFLSLGALISFS